MRINLYFVGKFIAQFILNIFFSRIEVVGKRHLEKTKNEAVIFVGNHANQFLDPAILVATAQRPIGFLTAAVSLARPFIGHVARMLHAIPVVRAQDLARSADGKISAKGIQVVGVSTLFTKQMEVGDTIKVSGQKATPVIAKILSDTELEVKSPFESDIEQVSFKIWPKLDHSQVYQHVWRRLNRNGAIGIFPEGGSHDNPHLIPLKAGVTLMALGAMDLNSALKVKIIPCGLNYFHGHRFRSHVMVEYGVPIEIPWSLVLQYRKDKRSACEQLLETIESRLRSVTLNYPSFQKMETLNLARRLYQPDVSLSADDFLKLQRRFVTFCVTLDENPQVQDMLKKVDEYGAELRIHGLQDFEIQTLQPEDSRMYFALILRFFVLSFILLLSIPGAVLNAPLGLISRVLARREAKRALQKSEVKVKGQDVIASYKVLVAVVLVPIAWFLYFLIFSFFYGWGNGVLFLLALPWFSYAAIRMLEQGLQIWRSSAPLLRSLTRSHFVERVKKLKERRKSLTALIRQLVTDLAPLMGPDWSKERVITQEMMLEEEEKSHTSSMVGINRRTYKATKTDAAKDAFADFATDFSEAKRPNVLGTSVEMERLKIFRKAEGKEDKSPRYEEKEK